MEIAESHLRPDGTVWPPVTPEPPSPPGYQDPVAEEPDDDAGVSEVAPEASTAEEA